MSKKKFKKNFKKDRERKPPKERNSSGTLLEAIDSFEGEEFTAQQLAKRLDVKKKTMLHEMLNDLDMMTEVGLLERNENNYKKAAPTRVTGKVEHVHPRYAFVIPEGGKREQSIYVRTSCLKSAIDGDTVQLEIFGTNAGKPEGKVTEVVKRGRNRFAGRVEVSRTFAFIIPDYKKIHEDFFVYPENLNGAKTNDKVVFEVTQWSSGDKCAEAKVIEVLGTTGDNDAEIHSIMTEFDLPLRFPEAVLREAEHIPSEISKEEIQRRRDFRNTLTFTIDPEDAKDFDDAISFKQIKQGVYEIGVHIADVTHYVKPHTALDDDGYDRATSVYLVDRTVPMLPERLSNELCSLRPHEDKLTFAAVFEIDEKADILKQWFGRTIIHSKRRFSYEQAQEVIETGVGDCAEEFKILNRLALKLRSDRFKKGAVNFETAEVKFKLDEKGIPVAVIPKVRKDAHKLIEEYMLLANKAVAEFVYEKGKGKNAFVYRTHDYPDPQKVADFAQFAKQFGHKINTDAKNLASALNQLMDAIEGKPEQNVLQSLAVRAMAKAIYTTDAVLHFGLAFAHYTHFTSPIRRYPDMMVHRLLQHYLDEGKPVSKTEYEEKCVHSSEREKRAADAERASIKFKQVEFMSYAAHKDYPGIITGVTDFGIFVEITETKCEGMVRLSDMKDDFYELDEGQYRVVGRRRRKVYRLGDEVVVRVKKTDVDRRLMDLTFEP